MSQLEGMVYLTDGFARLDLPGRRTFFTFDFEWIAHGSVCNWIWPHEKKGTIAGAEVEIVTWEGLCLKEIGVGDIDGPPEVVARGQEITFSPNIYVHLKERTRS